MAINFFKNQCKTTSTKNQFGLCDDINKPNDIAYLSENKKEEWIGIVSNANGKEVSFFAIDNCIQFDRTDGKQDKICDGVLKHKNILSFIELKSRRGGKWHKDGREQLTSTINHFRRNYAANEYQIMDSYICNKLKPLVNVGHAIQIQKFKDDTGLILKIQQNIDF